MASEVQEGLKPYCHYCHHHHRLHTYISSLVFYLIACFCCPYSTYPSICIYRRRLPGLQIHNNFTESASLLETWTAHCHVLINVWWVRNQPPFTIHKFLRVPAQWLADTLALHDPKLQFCQCVIDADIIYFLFVIF